MNKVIGEWNQNDNISSDATVPLTKPNQINVSLKDEVNMIIDISQIF